MTKTRKFFVYKLFQTVPSLGPRPTKECKTFFTEKQNLKDTSALQEITSNVSMVTFR